MKKKEYLVPTMRLHKLNSGKIMAASLGRADTTTEAPNTNPGVEDFEEVNAW